MVVVGVMPVKAAVEREKSELASSSEREQARPAVMAQEKRAMTVKELFELVETGSKTLQETKTSVDFAQKGVEAARAQRLPEVNASL